MRSSVLVGVLASGALAQNGAWQQCGGINFQGSTACISGYRCVYVNDWYSQCQPGAASPTTMTTSTTSTRSAPSSTVSSNPGTGSGKFKWFGVNQSGAEFGKGIFPGRWGTEFIFPDNGAIQVKDGLVIERHVDL